MMMTSSLTRKELRNCLHIMAGRVGTINTRGEERLAGLAIDRNSERVLVSLKEVKAGRDCMEPIDFVRAVMDRADQESTASREAETTEDRVKTAFNDLKENMCEAIDDAKDSVLKCIMVSNVADEFIRNLYHSTVCRDDIERVSVHLASGPLQPNEEKVIGAIAMEMDFLTNNFLKEIDLLSCEFGGGAPIPHLRVSAPQLANISKTADLKKLGSSQKLPMFHKFQRKSGICLGSRGIIKVPNSRNEFLLLSADGDFSRGNGKTMDEQPRKQKKITGGLGHDCWSSVTISPDGLKYCISDCVGRRFDIFNTGDDLLIHSEQLKTKPMRIAWLSNRQIVIGCDGGLLILFDLDTKKQLKSVSHFSDGIWDVCPIDKGQAILVGDNRNRTFKVSATDLQLIWSKTHHSEAVKSICSVKADGELGISAGGDKKVNLFRNANGELLGAYSSYSGFTAGVNLVKCSPCGRYIVGCSASELVL
jgi:hypothetical protein